MKKSFKRLIIVLAVMTVIFNFYNLLLNELQEIPVLLSLSELTAYMSGVLTGKALVFASGCAACFYVWQKVKVLRRLIAIKCN